MKRTPGKQYKSVRAMIRDIASPKFLKFWNGERRKDARLRAKYAKDPNHVHEPEDVGSFGRIGAATEMVFTRCKVCHLDMPIYERRVAASVLAEHKRAMREIIRKEKALKPDAAKSSAS